MVDKTSRLPHTYEPPVAELLRYGPCDGLHPKDWPNYVQELGLTAEHIPSLIEMVQDDKLWLLFAGGYDREDEFLDAGIATEDALWAPIHAWRALGQLQAGEAVKPLVEVLRKYDFDWCLEELPQVFGLMREEAIAPLEDLLSTKINYNNKVTLVSGLGEIGKVFPELRDRCVEVLTRQLSNFKQYHRTVNASLIAQLLDFKAVESVPVMEAAYTANKVDEMFVGPWARAQIELGLKQESDFTPEELQIRYTLAQKQRMANIRAYLDRQKSKASNSSATLPIRREGFEAPEFRDIATQASSKKSSPKPGFGQGAESGNKKSKKKK